MIDYELLWILFAAMTLMEILFIAIPYTNGIKWGNAMFRELWKGYFFSYVFGIPFMYFFLKWIGFKDMMFAGG